METQDVKEFIYLMPPAYYFKRAAIFKIIATVFEKDGRHYEAAEAETRGVYELALGLQSLVYQSVGRPA